MKTLLFIGLGVLLALSFACKKDSNPSDCTKLEGIWHAESWKEDTVQVLGSNSLVISSQLEFKVLTGDQGDYEWNTNYSLGQEMVIGSYVVNSDCNHVTLTPKGGTAHDDFDFHFNGDVLILEGFFIGANTEIQLRK
ncbi:MAG TPA: hypothetical protein VFG10_12385 [Saprospiraceae bacterium]|nr:hypothetical protein [Saprospiraceae bacterium]